MGSVVTVVLVFTLMAVVFAACCAAAGVHMLRVRNRVVPEVRSAAPVRWLWSARTPARLHRRLRRSVLGCRFALDGAFVDMAREVEERAVVLDRELVAVGRARMSSRARVVRDLRGEVEQVEALNQRLVSMARTNRSRTDLSAVRERLDALDAALRELVLEPPAAGAVT
jgi:hypothetical protein